MCRILGVVLGVAGLGRLWSLLLPVRAVNFQRFVRWLGASMDGGLKNAGISFYESGGGQTYILRDGF